MSKRAAAKKSEAVAPDQPVTELAYEAASTKRIAAKWRPTGADADSEIGGSQLANWRASDMARNDGRGAQAIRQIALHIVGTGIRPHAALPDDAVTKRAVALWNAWGQSAISGSGLSVYGHQVQAVSAMIERGETLVRKRPRRTGDGFIVPLQLQPMECDHLDQLKTEVLTGRSEDGTAYNAGEVVQGVEFDAIGRLAAYWLYPFHPGNILARGTGTSARITARDVIHLYPEPFCRVGQTRGITWLAPVLIRLRQLADYELTEGMRKKVAATQAVVVTGRENAVDPTATNADSLTGEVLTDSDGARIETIRPGMIAYATAESDVKLITPPVDQSYPQHLETELHQVAAGMGLPYEILTGDLSRVNYSSIKFGLSSFRRMCSTIRDLIVIPLLCQREWDWFIDAAIAADVLPDRAYPVLWRAPAWEEVDPWKEAKADAQELGAGLTTLHEVYAKRGKDFDETIATIAAERRALDALGLRFDFMPPEEEPDPAANPA